MSPSYLHRERVLFQGVHHVEVAQNGPNITLALERQPMARLSYKLGKAGVTEGYYPTRLEKEG